MVAMTSNLDKLVTYIRQTLDDLSTPLSDPAYEYASPPQCVIDAVFSIGARYESTENAVKHFCDRVGWRKDGRGRAGQERISLDRTLYSNGRKFPETREPE